MLNGTVTTLADQISQAAQPFRGERADLQPLIDLIGDARLVLIGEASHGTHEFYQTRALLTQRLIEEKGFSAVAAEADWPDAYRANRYARGVGGDSNADEALGSFKRFPAWMWRNTVMTAFIDWLRAYNLNRPENAPEAGFYGLDLYAMHSAMEAVIEYLDRVDPEAAKRARYRYSCFDHAEEDPQAYGYAAAFNLGASCETEVVEQLIELQRQAFSYLNQDGRVAEDAYFYAEQNARLAKNAEEYYRSMFLGRVSTWNLRDRHMAETLDALLAHLSRQQGKPAKVVVWAHNSHLGDARATEVSRGGELNLGQLVREQYGDDARLIGFSTYTGTVTAASDWGAPAERKRVRPALADSYEALLYQAEPSNFILTLRDGDEATEALRQPRLERAIGVIYRPETERVSHYFYAVLPMQFDAIIHYDETQALTPLERTAGWEQGELPETYPTGV